MSKIAVFMALFGLMAACTVEKSVNLQCPPPAGHSVFGRATVTYIGDPKRAIDEAEARATQSAQIECDRHQTAQKSEKPKQTTEQSNLKSNKKTGLGGAVGAGVIAAGLALIGGTSSSSDTQ